MKYCPACDRRYEDEMRLCGVDGTALEVVREDNVKRDAYIGRTIKGRYQIIKKLGEGGMGAVYLAEQISMARKVALKVLQGNYARDEEFIGRFRREARLAASLNHPYIVTVYDFDQGDDGALFIAMEYIDGKSLTEVIRRDGPLDIGRAARLGIQITEGLAAAHRSGVIHRDIKPDNIMVVGAEDVEMVKLMDFGIARLRDSGSMSRLTRAGVIMGTPAYMAPEQAEGAEVSERTDIYALGIVLYEMLSGSVPFRASTPGAVLVKQIQERPLALRTLRREIPAAIESTVMQALEKDPSKRQRDMREMAHGLKRIERPAADEPLSSTMVGEQATMFDEAPRTIAATQIWQSEPAGKPKIAGKYLIGGLVTVVALGALTFALLRPSNPPSKDQASPRESKIEVTDESANRPAPAPSTAKQPEVLPPAPIATAKGAAQKTDSANAATDSAATQDHTNLAKPLPAAKQPEVLPSKPVAPAKEPVPKTDSAKAAADSAAIQDRTNRAKPLPAAKQPEVLPSKPVAPATGTAQKTDSANAAADSAAIQNHISRAKSLRERGEYANARQELEKANSIAPGNGAVRAEIENVKKACNAERDILGQTSLNCG